MKAKTKISLCIPNYNRPGLTKKMLNSIIRQTLTPFEVVMIDDNSKDDMGEIKEICQKNDFKYLENKENLGLIKNINKAIQKASGEYIAIVHNDDLLSPFFIEEVDTFIRQYPDFNLYTTNCLGINSNGNLISEYRLFCANTEINPEKEIRQLWKNDFFCFFSIIGCTIYRREFIQKNLFKSSFGNESDLEKSLNLFKYEKIMYIDIPIYLTRIHKGQESFKNKLSKDDLNLYLKNRIIIYSRYKKYFSKINFYLEKIKAVHFLQLAFKYKYSLKEIKKNLKISSSKEILSIFALIPKIIINELFKKIKFIIRKKALNQLITKKDDN